MKHLLTALINDIKSRRLRGAAVSALTAIVVLAIVYAGTLLDELAGLLIVVCVGTIAYLIVTDSARHLHFSKAACYSAIVVGTAWVMTALHALAHLDQPLLRFTASTDSAGVFTGAYLEIAPIVFVSGIGLVVGVSGLIAYYIGRKRGDIKGIKKEDLFK